MGGHVRTCTKIHSSLQQCSDIFFLLIIINTTEDASNPRRVVDYLPCLPLLAAEWVCCAGLVSAVRNLAEEHSKLL